MNSVINYYDLFYGVVINNEFKYLIIFLISILIYYIFFKKYCRSIFDPLFFCLVACAISTSDVFFMYIFNLINKNFFYNYILTETSLIVGFHLFKPIKIKENINYYNKLKTNINKENYFLNVFYTLASVIYVIASVAFYYKSGLILFNSQYRLDAYGNSTFIYGLLIGLLPFIIYILVHRLFSEKKRKISSVIYDYFILFFIVITLILDGSKSDLIIIVNITFLYLLYNNRFIINKSESLKKIKKFLKKFLFVIILLIIVITGIRIIVEQNNQSIFNKLVYRILANGDIYSFYYMSDAHYIFSRTPLDGLSFIFYPIIYTSKKFINLFGFNVSLKIPDSIGYLMYHYFINPNVSSGCNARHNVFGLFYFGYIGSCIYSFLIGLYVSFCRNYLYKKLRYNQINGLLYTILVVSSINCITDVSLGMQELRAYILIFAFLLIASEIITKVLLRDKKVII